MWAKIQRVLLGALAVLTAASGCRDNKRAAPEAETTIQTPRDEAVPCQVMPFAPQLPVAEASGAVYVPGTAGQPAFVLVVGDSGTRGEYARIDAETGSVLEHGHLPLGVATSDDIEGLARMDEIFYGVTSAGFVRHWRRAANGFELIQHVYAIGSEPADVCKDMRMTNCGRNYEGLCLWADSAAKNGPCIGFVASKQDGRLHCLEHKGDRIQLRKGNVAIARPRALTGCAIPPDGNTVWAGTNLFGSSAVYRLENLADLATAQVTRVASLGPGFPEAIAAGPGGVLFRFSDTAAKPSLMAKYRCE